jgi:hypothetical protein
MGAEKPFWKPLHAVVGGHHVVVRWRFQDSLRVYGSISRYDGGWLPVYTDRETVRWRALGLGHEQKELGAFRRRHQAEAAVLAHWKSFSS